MHECCWFQQRGQLFLYKMLAKVDSAGMVTLLPRTGFLCTEGSLVFYQADYCLNCFSQNCQMLTLRTCGGGGGGGLLLPYKRLMGMCRWMGSLFHDWSDYNGVTFSIELQEWGHTFSDFWG